MPRKSTVEFAKKNLSDAEFAAWEAMPVKLSKKQLEAGERPPMVAALNSAFVNRTGTGGPDAICAEEDCDDTIEGGVQGMAHCDKHAHQPEDDEPETTDEEVSEHEGVYEAATNAAFNHGEQTEPEAETGDLVMLLNACWEAMSPEAKAKVAENALVTDLIESWGSNDR